jgi:hypothetical protein
MRVSGLRALGEEAIQEDSRYGEEVYDKVDQEHGEDVVHDDVVHGCCRGSDVCGPRRLDGNNAYCSGSDGCEPRRVRGWWSVGWRGKRSMGAGTLHSVSGFFLELVVINVKEQVCAKLYVQLRTRASTF